MLKQINERYIRSEKSYTKRWMKLEGQIRELKAKMERLRFPDFEKLFAPLFEEMRVKLKADYVETYGPFGLCGERSVYFMKRTGKKTERGKPDDKTLGGIAFIHAGDGWKIRDESKDTGEYSKGTIAEMNGANHPSIDITDEMDLDWLVKFAKRGR